MSLADLVAADRVAELVALGVHRDFARRRRANHKRLGLCSECSQPAEVGKSMCRLHLDKASARTRDATAWKMKHGLCVKCGRPKEQDRQDNWECKGCARRRGSKRNLLCGLLLILATVVHAQTRNIVLNWMQGVANPYCNGYCPIASNNVYRGTASGGPYTEIYSSSAPTTTYTDNPASYGLYYYVVTAVATCIDSTSTNCTYGYTVESAYSNQASANDVPTSAPSPLLRGGAWDIGAYEYQADDEVRRYNDHHSSRSCHLADWRQNLGLLPSHCCS